MSARSRDVVMAVYPNARGFAYVIFKASDFPLDWGVSEMPAQWRRGLSLQRLSRLLDRYDPDTVVLRHIPQSSRARRLIELAQAINELVRSRGVSTIAISREQVRRTFSPFGTPTRYAIAQDIAGLIPAFGPLLPRVRKIWNGEDRRMGLFDAIALARAFYQRREGEWKVGRRQRTR